MNVEPPPARRVHCEVALAPEEERDVEDDRDEKRRPQPEVLAANTLISIPRADPAPILYTMLALGEE